MGSGVRSGLFPGNAGRGPAPAPRVYLLLLREDLLLELELRLPPLALGLLVLLELEPLRLLLLPPVEALARLLPELLREEDEPDFEEEEELRDAIAAPLVG